MSQWQWVQWVRQWLYRSHSDEHRCVPGLCAHSISGQKSQRIGFRSGGQRLCDNQHTLKGEFQCELKNVLCVPDYSSNLLSVSRCTEWGHSFPFERGNSCMKLQKGTRVKLTRKKFVLPTLQRSRIQDEFQQPET